MKYIITIIAFATVLTCTAQETPPPETEHVLEFSAGIKKLSLLDNLNSPLVYRSQPKVVQISYERKGVKSITKVGLTAGMGRFLPSYYPKRTIYNNTYDFDGNLDRDSAMLGGGLLTAGFFGNYQRIIFENQKWQAYAGGGLSQQLYYPDSFVRTGYLNSFSMSLSGTVRYNLSKRSIFHGFVSLPVVALNTRFPYHSTLSHPDDSEVRMFFSQGTKLTSLHEFQQVDAGVEYRYIISNRWGVSLNYRFSWLKYNHPQTIKLMYNRLLAGITFKL